MTSVAPGSYYTRTITMTAPAVAGTYHPQYRMIQGGDQWFGETLDLTINVLGTGHMPIQTVKAPSMQGPNQYKGGIAGRVTTANPSAGIGNAYVAVVNPANTSEAYYVGSADAMGYFQFVNVNSTWNVTLGMFDARYKLYAYNSTYGEAYSTNGSTPETPLKPGPAIVAVVAGDGLAKVYEEFGVDQILNGGQSNNPSTGELLRVARLARSRRYASECPPARSRPAGDLEAWRESRPSGAQQSERLPGGTGLNAENAGPV
jgi:hypothetical protein